MQSIECYARHERICSMEMENDTPRLAIKVDPSKMGDHSVNAQLRARSCPTCGYPHAMAGEPCNDCRVAIKHSHARRQRQLDFNEFVYGSANPAHVFGVGYIDPANPAHKRYLDD